MGHPDYTSLFIHTEIFYLSCGFFASSVIIQIRVYLPVLIQEIYCPFKVGYTIKHTYVARQRVDALVLNPRKEVKEPLEYRYFCGILCSYNRYATR